MAKGDQEYEVIDYASKLQPGIKGEIAVNAGIYKGRYPSRVEDVDLENNIVGLAHPFMKGALMPAYRDMNLTFTLEDSTALYVFDLSVRRVDIQGPPIMWANILGEPERVQRRQFLRISCFWDVLIFHMENEVRQPMSSSWLSAKAIDISLGGYRFILPDEDAGDLTFESGDRMCIRFDLASREQLHVGRATRIVHSDEKWEVGVSFDALPVSAEKKLFEYIRQQEIMFGSGQSREQSQ
jgi:c-di-GMP-binding flagellar brake protein YcgR